MTKRPTKKQTGNGKRRPTQVSREGTLDQTSLEAVQQLSTTSTTTTTITTTTEAPRRHPKAPLHSPVEPKYTVDGGTETTRTIVDFFPESPSAAHERSEEDATETYVEKDPRTASEGNRERTSSDLERRRGRKKNKKTDHPTVPEEDPNSEYTDEEVEVQDYQNYLYGLENTEDSSSETVGVVDQFPEGLPDGYPTDRFRSDGNSSQNTR